MRQDSKWYQRLWLPFAAYVYITICVFDFMVMPIYVTAHNSRIENEIFRELNGKEAIPFADTLIKANQAQRQWNPLTLLGAGMFHLSFGALLTGGAITRGFAKKSEIEGYYRTQMYGYDPGPFSYNTMPYRNQPVSQNDRRQAYTEDMSNAGPIPKTQNLDDGNN